MSVGFPTEIAGGEQNPVVSGNGAANDIAGLAAETLADSRNVRVVEFVDRLLFLAAGLGSLHCAPAGESTLHFRTDDQPICGVELECARGKLRMACARLAVVCKERGGQPFSPYGDRAEFDFEVAPNRRVHMKVRFVNTPGQQEFSIQTQPA